MLSATFRHSWSYSCILRHIQNTWLIQAYLEPEIYLVSFRRTLQVLLRSNLFIFWILFTQTQAYLELWFIYRHVMFHVCSGIFSTLEYVIKQYFMQKKNFQTWNRKWLICGILGFKFEKCLPYLKSAPTNWSKYKFRSKIKIFKWGTKYPFF